MGDNSENDLLVTLGKAQVDAMFCRQEDYPLDDSEFLPLAAAHSRDPSGGVTRARCFGGPGDTAPLGTR